MKQFEIGSYVTPLVNPGLRMKVESHNASNDSYGCGYMAGSRYFVEDFRASTIREMTMEEAHPHRFA